MRINESTTYICSAISIFRTTQLRRFCRRLPPPPFTPTVPKATGSTNKPQLLSLNDCCRQAVFTRSLCRLTAARTRCSPPRPTSKTRLHTRFPVRRYATSTQGTFDFAKAVSKPFRYQLCNPELQRQSRGKTAYLTGFVCRWLTIPRRCLTSNLYQTVLLLLGPPPTTPPSL